MSPRQTAMAGAHGECHGHGQGFPGPLDPRHALFVLPVLEVGRSFHPSPTDWGLPLVVSIVALRSDVADRLNCHRRMCELADARVHAVPAHDRAADPSARAIASWLVAGAENCDTASEQDAQGLRTRPRSAVAAVSVRRTQPSRAGRGGRTRRAGLRRVRSPPGRSRFWSARGGRRPHGPWRVLDPRE